MMRAGRWGKWPERLAAGALIALAGLLLIGFFAQWPIEGTTLALDWKGIWLDLQGNRPHFNTNSLLIVPWDGLLLLPLGWLPMRVSWATAAWLTLGVLVVSVPRTAGKWRHLLGIGLLATSFPAVRHIADGNLEGLVIGGLLLTVYGYDKQNIWALAAGLLLATAKVQEAWLPCLVLAYYLLKTWPPRRLVRLGALLAIVVVPTMLWLGPEWIYGLTHVVERGSIMDSSLVSTFGRLNLPAWLSMVGWLALASLAALYAWRSGPTFSRQKASALVAASLLLSPYAAGNSYLTLLAIGVIPMLLTGNLLVVVLMLLVDLPYFVSRSLLYSWSATYWTVLILLWFAIVAIQPHREPQPEPGATPVAEPRP